MEKVKYEHKKIRAPENSETRTPFSNQKNYTKLLLREQYF